MTTDEIEVCTTMVLPDEDGIECDTDVILIVRVDHYMNVKGSHSHNAASDMDFYGYEEMDYTVMKILLDNGTETEVPMPEGFNENLDDNDKGKIEDEIRTQHEDWSDY